MRIAATHTHRVLVECVKQLETWRACAGSGLAGLAGPVHVIDERPGLAAEVARVESSRLIEIVVERLRKSLSVRVLSFSLIHCEICTVIFVFHGTDLS